MDSFKLEITKDEVFRYLGYKGGNVDSEIHSLAEHCIRRTRVLIEPAFLYKKFHLDHSNADGIRLSETDVLLKGHDIAQLLAGCTWAVLMCTTLGTAFDRQIRIKISEEPTKGVIYDSCGSAAIEALTDYAQAEIEKQVGEGCGFTARFSPGYGDLPIELNRTILELLDSHRKIGLTVTPGFIMTPRKSVTAIFGVIDKKDV